MVGRPSLPLCTGAQFVVEDAVRRPVLFLALATAIVCWRRDPLLLTFLAFPEPCLRVADAAQLARSHTRHFERRHCRPRLNGSDDMIKRGWRKSLHNRACVDQLFGPTYGPTFPTEVGPSTRMPAHQLDATRRLACCLGPPVRPLEAPQILLPVSPPARTHNTIFVNNYIFLAVKYTSHCATSRSRAFCSDGHRA